ncbi:galactokinase [Candidatus Hakubella thermalkaliphila]|uniref:Galactokinase n=1 Tax=Candidatus Hakubella thermalkaliphila TaxID=2754717 RepID=A0A6V8Q5G8_9ACTN|nr:galactokinase [Candidatus Hakubella thermalkaliphila]GFP39958.1 galactokinase [Candidatus Hakubella thermalkaliphila]
MILESRLEELKECLQDQVDLDPQKLIVARASGRANLIGEHTDYNQGLVLPIAVDRDVLVAGVVQEGDQVTLHSLDFQDQVRFGLKNIVYDPAHPWANYTKGVVQVFKQKGYTLSGFVAAIHGNIPIGAGMSSSAAIEVAVATFLEETFGLKLDPREVALWCVEAENNFVGVNCGIMDQFASKLGKKDHALFIDCRDYSYEYVPFHLDSHKVLLVDSKLGRDLASTEYNIRRAKCEEALNLLKSQLPEVTSLRDVTLAQLERMEEKLGKKLAQRVRHVLSENQRVLKAKEALQKGDLHHLGRLLVQSHLSLRDDFEVVVWSWTFWWRVG